MAQTLLQSSPDQAVSSLLAQAAWVPILRGVAALLFGLVALFWPGIALSVVVALFGIYACIDGFLALIASFRMAGRHDPWIALLLEGIVGIAAGIIVFRTPGLAAVALVYVVAAWAIVTGCMEIVSAVTLRRYIAGEWALGLSGLLSVILGWLLFAQPLAGVVTLVWLIGLYAVFFGGLMIYVGVRLSRLSGSTISGEILSEG
jgi:uncharacterized membrane protein HdeD (DUF308 family)